MGQLQGCGARQAMWKSMPVSHCPSLECVPDPAPAALLVQVSILNQVTKVLLQRISAYTRQFDRVANCDASMLPGKFDNLQ